MQLLVYEHPCGMLHSIVDTASIPGGQPILTGSGLEVPQYNYMPIDLREWSARSVCKGCKYRDPVEVNDKTSCRGKYQGTLSEQEIVLLPERVRRAEAELKAVRSEVEFLRVRLDDAEREASDLRVGSRKAEVAAETVERLIKDIDLYLAQVAVSRTAYANAGKHLQFICDLAQDARKRLSEVEISA